MASDNDHSNINRQLSDILSQIERILSGKDDFETLENFASYSEDLKSYVRAHSEDKMILERIDMIPVINLKTGKTSAVLLLFSSLVNRYHEYMVKKKALEDIRIAQGYYSSIQFLFKNDY